MPPRTLEPVRLKNKTNLKPFSARTNAVSKELVANLLALRVQTRKRCQMWVIEIVWGMCACYLSGSRQENRTRAQPLIMGIYYKVKFQEGWKFWKQVEVRQSGNCWLEGAGTTPVCGGAKAQGRNQGHGRRVCLGQARIQGRHRCCWRTPRKRGGGWNWQCRNEAPSPAANLLPELPLAEPNRKPAGK